MPHVTLAAATPLPADDLPREFRLFKRGLNETSKGSFLFDDAAARSVLAAQGREGVDLMIDLEHLSLDAGASSYDPDARAWCQLAVRNGELWATNVRWTPDGAERLRSRKQRYISPVVDRDAKTHRVLSVLNLALVGMPATHGAQALVAASKGLTRAGSTVLRTRVTKESAAVVCALARQRGMTPSALVRKMLVALAASPFDDSADRGLATIRELLSLPPDADRGAVVAAIDALYEIVGEPASANNDPLADVAAAPPAQLAARKPAPAPAARLSAAQVKALARARMPISHASFEALKARAVTRAGERPAPTPRPAAPSAEHLAKCAQAVRRR